MVLLTQQKIESETIADPGPWTKTENKVRVPIFNRLEVSQIEEVLVRKSI